MRRARTLRLALALLAVGVSAASVALFTTSAVADRPDQIHHVLLISVDGMHQSDLEWYVARHSDSELATLVDGGAAYSNNHTSESDGSDV